MPPINNIEAGPDTIRILLTTDNHVGYKELDPIIGDDSWKTFHEITNIAKERDVDMILQGGDLFHINKPSKKSLFHVMKSLRMNCLGDRPCELELLSDPSLNLSNGFNTVNYEDPNINVSIPVFAISGNHDDATGDGMLSPLDVLSISGLINHFGKISNNEDITVSPLLFQKGSTKFALYGMSNVRDERLHRAFRDGLVKFLRPNIQTDEWFNLLCFHQNHAEHSRTSHIPEIFLPRFLNFILWGHEHECIPNPVYNPETGFDVLQAGSSVATSLSDGEQREKHVFILNIKGKNYSIEPIKLNSVRPFIMEEISLSKSNLIPGEASKADVMDYLSVQIERLIKVAVERFKEANSDYFKDIDDYECYKDKIPLPLIRLRVEYSGGYELENARRFSNKFVEKIANVNDVVQFYKKKFRDSNDLVQKVKFSEEDLLEENMKRTKNSDVQLHDLIKAFLQQAELSLLPEQGLIHAVNKFVENDDKHILDQYITNEIEQETKMLLELNINDEELYDQGGQQNKKVFKNLLKQIKQENKSPNEITIANKNSSSKGQPKSKSLVSSSDNESDKEYEAKLSKPPRSNKGVRKEQSSVIEIDSDDETNNKSKQNRAIEIVSDSEADEYKAKSISSNKKSTKPVNARKVTKKSKKAQHTNNESGNGSLLDSIMSMGKF